MSCPNRRFARTASFVVSVFACGVVFVVASLPAWADTERDRQTKACKGDALRLCALAIPNEKKIAACMARKKEKLSPACHEYFKDTSAPPAKTKAKGQAGRHTTPAMH